MNEPQYISIELTNYNQEESFISSVDMVVN